MRHTQTYTITTRDGRTCTKGGLPQAEPPHSVDSLNPEEWEHSTVGDWDAALQHMAQGRFHNDPPPPPTAGATHWKSKNDSPLALPAHSKSVRPQVVLQKKNDASRRPSAVAFSEPCNGLMPVLHACEAAGYKMETLHFSGPTVQVRPTEAGTIAEISLISLTTSAELQVFHTPYATIYGVLTESSADASIRDSACAGRSASPGTVGGQLQGGACDHAARYAPKRHRSGSPEGVEKGGPACDRSAPWPRATSRKQGSPLPKSLCRRPLRLVGTCTRDETHSALVGMTRVHWGFS